MLFKIDIKLRTKKLLKRAYFAILLVVRAKNRNT